MSGRKPIDVDIQEKAQDFRDPDTEYLFVAYVLRVSPMAAGFISGEWLSDVILQDIFSVVDDLRVVLSKPMVLTELRNRNIMRTDEKAVFDETLDVLFSLEVSSVNDKSVRQMAKQILQLGDTRRILVGCGKIIGSMRSFDYLSAKRQCAEMGRSIEIFDKENAGFYLDGFEDRVALIKGREEEAAESDGFAAGIKTGVYRFDRFTGGLMPKEFGVVLGITGVGKTAALIEFGVNAWEDGHDVLIVSGEMDRSLLEFRVDSRITRIEGMKFRNAELDTDDYSRWENTIKKYRAEKDNVLYISSYPRRFNAETIERDIIRVQEESGRKLSLLCVDYINIMEPVKKSRGNWEDQSEAIWDLKGLLSEYNMCGWTAGQVKDDAYEKELYDAQDAKYARAISEAAPIIVALIRTPKDMLEGRMKFQTLKMRNADIPKKPIILTPNLGIMRLHEEIIEKKTLRGRKSDVLDAKVKTRSVRPRRDLHGKI